MEATAGWDDPAIVRADRDGVPWTTCLHKLQDGERVTEGNLMNLGIEERDEKGTIEGSVKESFLT